jgi:hypothetical protein
MPKSNKLLVVISWLANAILAAHFRDFHPCVGFFESRHYLALCELALFHRFVCFVATRNSSFNLFRYRGLLHLFVR